MNAATQEAINRKCERAASRLQREKYAKTGLTRKQFHPCPRGLVYTAAMNSGRVLSEIENEAVLTPCSCHPGFNLKMAWDYQQVRIAQKDELISFYKGTDLIIKNELAKLKQEIVQLKHFIKESKND